MTTDRGNPGDTVRDPGDEQLDADLVLLTEYLADELGPEQAAAVEKRLAEDEAFYDRALPYLQLWSEPVDYRKELAKLEAERKGALPAPLATAPTSTDVVHLPTVRARRAITWPLVVSRRRAMSLLAAVLALMFGLPVVAYQVGFTSGEREGLLEQPRVVPGNTPEGKTSGGALAGTEVAVVPIGHSSLLHLRYGARFAHTPAPWYLREIVGLNGEAFVEVGWLDIKVSLSTPAGVVDLWPGSYAVRAKADTASLDETLITVRTGRATMRGARGTPDLTLRAGEFGRLTYVAAPERTSGGANYPKIPRKGWMWP